MARLAFRLLFLFVLGCLLVLHAPAARAQSCVPPTDGLVAWWPLDGSTADLIDHNPASPVGDPSFSSGEVGGGLSLDGVDDAALIPASPLLDVGRSAGFTIALWIDPVAATSQPLVEWNNGSMAGAHFWIGVAPPLGGGDGSLYANLLDTEFNNHIIASAGGLVRPGLFHQVAATYDQASGSAALYLDGEPVASQFLADFRANHQFPCFSDFDLERFAGVGSGNGVEIAFITDDTILATSPTGQDTGIIGERLGGVLQPFSSKPTKGNFSRGPMHTRIGGRVEPGERLIVEIVQILKM